MDRAAQGELDHQRLPPRLRGDDAAGGLLADLWGARRLFMGALTVFVVGSALAGASQNLDQLIAARLVQGVGGGVLVPVATAAASHLFEGHDRPRALGVIGALTFLGMAAGPFVGAAILGGVHVDGTVERLGLEGGTLAAALAPSWRWIFYVNVPIGIVAIVLAWAASAGWDTPRRPGCVDFIGASLFTIALASGLIGLTLLGSGDIAGVAVDPAAISAGLFAIAAVATVLTIVRDLRQETPFLEVRLFRSVSFSSAILVSLLTGYAFATAIIGGAVFVDRVLYGGPNDQRLRSGARRTDGRRGAGVGFCRPPAVVAARDARGPRRERRGAAGHVEVDRIGRDRAGGPRARGLRLRLRADGHAALHRGSGVGRPSVVRDRLGRCHGLAHDRHGDRPRHPDRVRVDDDRPAVRPGVRDPEAYQTVIPEDLHDRPLRDLFVVEALEDWASREAAGIVVGLFVVAAVVTIAAIPPGLSLSAVAGASRSRKAPPPRSGRQPAVRQGAHGRGSSVASQPSSSEDRRKRPRPPARARPRRADDRRRPAATLDAGVISVASYADGAVQGRSGEETFDALPALMRAKDAAVWVDLASPSPRQVERVGATSGSTS